MNPHQCDQFKLLKSRSKALISLKNKNQSSVDIGYTSFTARSASLLVKSRCPSREKFLKSVKGEDLHRDTINFRILGYSIFLAFVSVILAITLMKRYCECCYDDPKRTDDLNISYWLYKTMQNATGQRETQRPPDRPDCYLFQCQIYILLLSLLMTYWNTRMEPRVSFRTVSLRMAEFDGHGQFLSKSIFVCRRQVRQKREVCLRQIARWHIGQWRRQCRVLHSLKIRLRRHLTSSKKVSPIEIIK